MSSVPTIRKMKIDDLNQVVAIEQLCQYHPWTLGIFSDCLRVGYHCWVAEYEDKVIGFLIFSLEVEEQHILDICIHPDMQGRGLGKQLMQRAVEYAKQHYAQIIFLEVRQSNTQAISFYKQFGFEPLSLRKHYYKTPDGREDAVVMTLKL